MMTPMKWVLLFLPVLSGCFLFRSTDGSSLETVPSHLKDERPQVPEVYDLHPYGSPALIPVGSWATYTLTQGVEIQKVTLAAVTREEGGIWIEVIEEADPRRVSSRCVTPDGRVDKAWYVELRSDGTKIPPRPQPIIQFSEPPRPALTLRSREAHEEERRVAGTPLKVTVVRTSFEDLNGRTISEETVWCTAAPSLYAGSREGGLVRKSTEGLTVELAAFGTDAKPLVEIPK